MSRRGKQQRFEIGGFWLSQRPNSPAWCRTWFDSQSRQTRRASLGASDFEAAKLELAAWVQQNAKMDREKPQAVLLETILVRWFNAVGRLQASAVPNRYALAKWSDQFPGALVSEVNAASLRDFAKTLGKGGYSDAYIRRIFAIGKRALNWAVEEELLDRAPFVKLPADGEARSRAMTMMEAAWFLKATAEDLPHVRLYVALAFGTAARPSSILELSTFRQLDFEAGVIDLNPPGRRQNKKFRPAIPMADFLVPFLESVPPGRVILFNDKPLKSIRSAIERVRDRARSMIRHDAAGRVLAAWRAGDKAAAAKILRQAKEMADAMLTVSAYTLRHTVATELRGRGVQPWELSGFLGHSSGYRTTEGYAKNRPEHLRGVVRALDAYWSDLGALLDRQHLGPVVNQEQRSSCVLPSQLPKGIKPLGYLVEPNGIEPLTSTMPL